MRRDRLPTAPTLLWFFLVLSSDSGIALPTGETRQGEKTIALTGATIYPSPTDAPIPQGVVVVRSGTIVEVGPRDDLTIPAGATWWTVTGCTFSPDSRTATCTSPSRSGKAPPSFAARNSRRSSRRCCCATGSPPSWTPARLCPQTIALRERIESGEVRGPRILTAGTPLYPENGIPYYLKSSLPPAVLALLNTPKTGEEAAAIAAKQIEAGADIVKAVYRLMGRARPRSADVRRHSPRRGRIARGMDADIVVLAADPSADVRAFTDVGYTLRRGRIVYKK